jgi:polyhydroxybutyrate depolymerase
MKCKPGICSGREWIMPRARAEPHWLLFLALAGSGCDLPVVTFAPVSAAGAASQGPTAADEKPSEPPSGGGDPQLYPSTIPVYEELPGGVALSAPELPDTGTELADAAAERPPLGDAKDPSPGCASLAAPGSGRRRMGIGGIDRDYDLVVPDGLDGAAPLLLALHGFMMTSAGMATMTGMSELAQREGFVVAYPQGIGAPTSWNAGTCCAQNDPERPDLEFMARLIDDLETILCIDRSRVYAAGFSNGGMLAYRMACAMSDRIAAIGAVSGSLAGPLEQCAPSRPVALLHVHGTADPIVPFEGGEGSPLLTPLGSNIPSFPSVAAELDRFASLDGCRGPAETVFRRDDTTCKRHGDCSNEAVVQLCTIEGGGHTWPGGAPLGLAALVVGSQSPTLPTTELLWSFLSQHRLPALTHRP